MSDKKIEPDITLNCEILWIKKAGTVGGTIPADMLVGRDYIPTLANRQFLLACKLLLEFSES